LIDRPPPVRSERDDDDWPSSLQPAAFLHALSRSTASWTPTPSSARTNLSSSVFTKTSRPCHRRCGT
jgi:hypothetical protein